MIFLLTIYAFVALFVLPGLIKKKEWRELVAFSVFYIIAFVLGLMYVLDITVPSPMKVLEYLIGDVMGIKYPQL